MANEKLAELKKQQKQKAELDKLKKQKEKAVEKLEKLKQKKVKEQDIQKGKMDQIWGKFSSTLDMKYWDQAQEMWQKLDEDGYSVALLQADTMQRY